MNIWRFINIPVSDEHRRRVLDAQFVLGPSYVDWVWTERVKEHPPVNTKPLGVWPFKRETDNVVQMKAKVKK